MRAEFDSGIQDQTKHGKSSCIKRSLDLFVISFSISAVIENEKLSDFQLGRRSLSVWSDVLPPITNCYERQKAGLVHEISGYNRFA